MAGALIGLLFVAISVAPQRVTGDGADPAHRIRASAALTAFTNALSISLFALIPTVRLGGTTTVVGVVGLLFVAASLLSVVRQRRSTTIAFRDVSFLAGLLVVFVSEIIAGLHLLEEDRTSAVSSIAILTVVCFLIGIARAWELIGASNTGLRTEVTAAIRDRAQVRPATHTPVDPTDPAPTAAE